MTVASVVVFWKEMDRNEVIALFECIEPLSVLLMEEATAISIPYGDALMSASTLWEMISWTYDVRESSALD